MEMRDLKADLEQVRNFRSKWRQSSSLEEAWDIGVAWEHFCREKAELWEELWLDQALAEKERADKAEALVRELVEVLKKHEQWEADFILDDKAWATVNGLPQFTQEVYDAWLEFQTVRNKVLVKAKEVLDDEA